VAAATPGGRALARARWTRVGDPADLDLLDAAALLRARRLSSVELTRACLKRIRARNGGAPTFDGSASAINAWARLYPELALRQARAADRRLARGRQPLLCGIPLGLKDLFAVEGLPLTASSHVLDGNVAGESSSVWARLRRAGTVLVGHTQTHEFGAGATTDQVGNPWLLSRSAGGSSGGSAAALAARMVPAAVGTDTGGSLRFPAALCGVSTIKPTRGRVPTGGMIPVATSFDHPGPLGRTVADCAALLQALGPGRLRLATRPRRGARPLAGLRVALTDRLPQVDADVAEGLDRARFALAKLGAQVVARPAPPAAGPSDAGYAAIFNTDLWAYHRRYAARANRYRPAIAQLVREAAAAYGDGYAVARRGRDRVTAAWLRWFADGDVDLVLEPTIPIVAPPRGTGYAAVAHPELAPLVEFGPLWNATGFPVVALPAGRGRRSGLPVSVSLVAPTGAEAVAVQAAVDLQARELPPPVARGLDTRLGV
jgi:aspartyl-tRNA(Asn)/glutamyl-tRNA(Gln) amidotransferase subunit A